MPSQEITKKRIGVLEKITKVISEEHDAIKSRLTTIEGKMNEGTTAKQPAPSTAKVSVPATAVTSQGTAVVASTALTSTPTGFQKFIAVLEALEPVIIAGAAPFIKNPQTGAIIAAELPVAQALLQALQAL